MEIWKDVVGYEGIYKVSNTGIVKSIDRIIKTKNNGTRIQYGHIRKNLISGKGYTKVHLNKDGIRFQAGVHRLVAIAFIANPFNFHQVNHKDGNKLNNNDWNLEWIINKYNAIHASKNGLNNTCRKCNVIKDLSEFRKIKGSKTGYSNTCLVCYRKRKKELYPKNKETASKYYHKNKEKILNDNKLWIIKNYDSRKKYSLEYYDNNKEIIISKRKGNKKHELYVKEYNLKNRLKINQRQNELNRKNPHIVAFRNSLKNTLSRMNIEKTNKSIYLLGYSALDLKSHLESLFIDDMSWNNHGKGIGKWEIDHIIPVSCFKKDTPIKIVNSLCNLRPLYWIDNYIKKDKIILSEINKDENLIYIYEKYTIKK